MKYQMPPVKFLLVDDREENLTALAKLLERDGLEILQARSGRDALELLLTHETALALIDVQMPGMDGFELAELMRGTARTRAVPIIFVTASHSEDNRIFKGYDAGAVDFLQKPVDPRILWHKTETFFQLERQRQQLVETLRLNETFVAAVGHDLRNPLSAIMTGVQVLEMTATDERTRQTVARLRSSGKRMSAIIDDLFDLARARLGNGIAIAPTSIDLPAVIDRVVAEHRAAHPRRTVDVQISGAPSGTWDGTRLEQVIANLVDNAERHGARDVPITVRFEGAAAEITLSVHNGGAIRPELLPVLFDPFRSGRERGSRDGLGLGLFIVNQIVEAHGGHIEVRSTEADGTTFVVRLPRVARCDSKPPPADRQ
jgi:two-component system, sensor histidine kinase and response regulator